MDKLLKMALEKADAAEVYLAESSSSPLNIFNYRYADMMKRELLEVSLRVIKDGKIGVSKGSFSEERGRMVEDAVDSARFGAKAKFDFPGGKVEDSGLVYDPELASSTDERLVDDSLRIVDRLKKSAPEMPVNIYMTREVKKVSILNSSGKNDSYKKTSLTICLMSIYDRSKEGITKEITKCGYFTFPEEKIDELIREYMYSKEEFQIPTRPMPVLFRYSATWSLMYRLLEGAGGRNWVKGVSPLIGKMGKPIFPESVSINDDPTLPRARNSVPFDDEGVPTFKKSIVDRGVLKSFIFDLDTGAKSGKGSTGNGFKVTMWTEGIEDPPNPRFSNLVLLPGDSSFDEMVKDMREGIIVNDVIGFHSGNILQGEFSMNVGVGFYVKDRRICGRAVNAMIAGNVYDDFKNLASLGRNMEETSMGFSPDLYFSTMSVSGSS